jgi:hypothetical protein
VEELRLIKVVQDLKLEVQRRENYYFVQVFRKDF